MTLLNRPLLIAGMFREALFHSCEVNLTSQGSSWLIDSIEEKAAREISDRKMTLKWIRGASFHENPLQTGTEIQLECHFPRSIGQWSSEVLKVVDNKITITLPTTLKLVNRRKSQSRISIHSLQADESEVLIQTGSAFSEGMFRLENISQDGAGGILRPLAPIPVLNDTTLSGVLCLSSGELKLNAQVVSATWLQQESESTAQFRVGLRFFDAQTNTIVANDTSQGTFKEKRNFRRFPAKFFLQLISAFDSHHRIDLDTLDVSTTGFAAMIKNPEDAHFLPIGIHLVMSDLKLPVILVGFDQGVYRFQIDARSSDHHILWMKRVTPFLDPSISTKASVSSDLIELFCESGALASAYLKEQRVVFDKFERELRQEARHDTWVHRWFEKNAEGKIKGHISSMRISDSVWYTGDIAGRMQSDLKISKAFLRQYFEHFKEFSLSGEPCRNLLWLWVEGHPYWSEFEQYIRGIRYPERLAFLRVGYHRLEKTKVAVGAELGGYSARWIHSSEYREINRVLEKMPDPEVRQFIRSMDFSIENFGSPNLSRQMQQCGLHLKRRFAIVKGEDREYLLIFQQFPTGVSLTRTADVPWIIPLGSYEDESDAGRHGALVTAVKNFGIAQGYSFPGVMLFLGPEFKSQLFKAMTALLIHPKLLEFYK